VSREATVHVVPSEDISHVTLGGGYSFDFGKRPSLWGLIDHEFQHASISEGVAALRLDLRHDRRVCDG
jgi:hypothetical protein